MKIIDTIRTSIPVLIETGYDEWPYAIRGTFFVAEIKSDLYVITARHVVEGNDESSVFFRYSSGSRSSLPLNEVIRNKEYKDESSPGYTDVILYKVAKYDICEDIISAKVDTDIKPWETLCESEVLYARGYPSELQENTCYWHKEQGVLFSATYSERAEDADFCHRIRLCPTEIFTDYDGFSGSPVYCVRNGARLLVGVLIKATAYQNIGLFVDASVFIKMIG